MRAIYLKAPQRGQSQKGNITFSSKQRWIWYLSPCVFALVLSTSSPSHNVQLLSMLLQSLLVLQVKMTWQYACLTLRWPCCRRLQNSTAHLWLIQKVSRVKKKEKKERKIKMRGGSEINWMMIKLSVLFSGFEFTRSPCFWEQQKFMWLLLLSNSRRRHFSTRDPHSRCTSRPFGSSTCYYTVLALPSLLYCGIAPPGPHSSQTLDWPSHFRL